MTEKRPSGLGKAGAKLWDSVLTRFEFDGEHETALLQQACRTLDHIADLDAAVTRDGVLVRNAKGDDVAHPGLVEGRQQRLTLARLIASLRLPEDIAEGRPQRRGAARRPYKAAG